MTTRERILKLCSLMGNGSLTAVGMVQLLNFRPAKRRISKFPVVHLSSVSSLLKKMVDAGQLERVAGFGPRGGYCYRKVSNV